MSDANAARHAHILLNAQCSMLDTDTDTDTDTDVLERKEYGHQNHTSEHHNNRKRHTNAHKVAEAVLTRAEH